MSGGGRAPHYLPIRPEVCCRTFYEGRTTILVRWARLVPKLAALCCSRVFAHTAQGVTNPPGARGGMWGDQCRSELARGFDHGHAAQNAMLNLLLNFADGLFSRSAGIRPLGASGSFKPPGSVLLALRSRDSCCDNRGSVELGMACSRTTMRFSPGFNQCSSGPGLALAYVGLPDGSGGGGSPVIPNSCFEHPGTFCAGTRSGGCLRGPCSFRDSSGRAIRWAVPDRTSLGCLSPRGPQCGIPRAPRCR